MESGMLGHVAKKEVGTQEFVYVWQLMYCSRVVREAAARVFL
jgi:hypothetical protein